MKQLYSALSLNKIPYLNVIKYTLSLYRTILNALSFLRNLLHLSIQRQQTSLFIQ